MGATRGVQLKAEEVPFDGLAIAQALAAELKDGGYDLILFGRMATDTANGTVGPMTAELLGLPCVTSISHLEIADGRGSARRDLEGAAETLEFPLPAVLTIDEGIARPRLASLKGIMAAKKKPLDVKPAQLGESRLVVESMALPPDRPPGRIIGEGAAAVPELLRLLQTEAKVL
jgi:electron transfer flavoprotein beta subunit